MKVLLLNGSPNEKGCTYTALEEVARELAKGEIQSEFFQVGKKPVRGCAACYKCRQVGAGQCVFDDDAVNAAIGKIKEADALVIGSPVYYAGLSGQLKALLDRSFFAGGGYANKLGAAVVSCRRGGASAAFDQINHYFGISKMHIVASQYWNQVHGTTPDEVRQDLEGLQTMRTLAKNMVWLLKCIEAGQKANIPQPIYEAAQHTNFIR